jgi:DNA polymerase III epsilon subunit-like protein
MNKNEIIVMDFETTGLDTSTCEITQIAAVVVNPRRLTIVDEFNTEVRPLDFDAISEDALKVTRKTKEGLALAPHPEQVWGDFKNFCDKYNFKKTPYTAPIMAGYNILGYDLPILNRYAKKYGTVDNKTGKQNLFSNFMSYDLIHEVYWWHENSSDLPNIKLTTLCEWLGLDTTKAHDALYDVKNTAKIMIKFMRLKRYLFPKIKFAGSCIGEQDE